MLTKNFKIMKTTKLIIISLIAVFLTSCKGDKKSIIGADLSDESFVNTNFDGNLINYDENMSACRGFTQADLATHYDVSIEDIMIRDSTVDDRLQSLYPTCKLTVMVDGGYLQGDITVIPEAQKDENWEETWAFKKASSKSAEWVNGVGQAALWKPNKRELLIKFDGYLLTITVPGLNYDFNKKEINDKYHKIALKMAKSAGYIK